MREREAVQALVELGVLAWRTAQRMGSAGDAADVVIEGSGIHVEVKGTEKLKWKATIEQCTRDAKGKPWIILHRTNRGEWMVISHLHAWAADSVAMSLARAERRNRLAQVVQAEQAGP